MNKGTYTYAYPRPSVTTDCVIFGFDAQGLSVLLIERGIEPFKRCRIESGVRTMMAEKSGVFPCAPAEQALP